MRQTSWLGLVLVSLGCTRPNPAFDDGSSTPQDGSTSAATLTGAATATSAATVTGDGGGDVATGDVTTAVGEPSTSSMPGDGPLPLDLPPADCCSPGPSCARPEVAACVCAEVPECCSGEWTETCVQWVDSLRCDECGLSVESCCVLQDLAPGSPSCQIPAVEGCVCKLDPFCCSPEGYWDAWCVTHAVLQCHTVCDPLPGDCCVPAPLPGCNDFEIVDCVCDAIPNCCAQEWDLGGECPGQAFDCGGC